MRPSFLFICVPVVLAGSYAPVPKIEPSPSAYGSPYSSQQQVEAYGYRNQQTVENTVYAQQQESPIPIRPTPPQKTYQYPIQAPATQKYEYQYPSTIYSDFELTSTTTTLPTTYVPVKESSEDEENYGVPEIVPSSSKNPSSPVQPVPNTIQTQSYAPAPQIQPAVSAYGAAVPSSRQETHFNGQEDIAVEAVPENIPTVSQYRVTVAPVTTKSQSYAAVPQVAPAPSAYGVSVPSNRDETEYNGQEDTVAEERTSVVPEVPPTLPQNRISPASVSKPAQSYAAAPLVPAAPSAYGAPVPAFRENVEANGKDTAVEVPPAEVVPEAADKLLSEFYPARGVQPQKKKIRAQRRFDKSH